MSVFQFQKNVVYTSNNLPLTLMSLEEWSLIYVYGSDSKKHLQNQLTIDMNLLKKKDYQLCAHCNINGKVWSTIIIFHYKKGYVYIIRKSISEKQIIELKKYSIFFDIKFKKLNKIYLLGVSGINVRSFLKEYFINIPDKKNSVCFQEENVILYFSKPCERFLLALHEKDFLSFHNKISQTNKKILFNDSRQWCLLDIEAGFPIINKKTSKKFLPQSINLNKLNAINFNKGCYYGQEIIAKVFYKNLNKYSLYVLIGSGNIYPEIGVSIETKIQGEWHRVGTLLEIVHLKLNKIWIQAVLKKSINFKEIFRIYGFKNLFLIKD